MQRKIIVVIYCIYQLSKELDGTSSSIITHTTYIVAETYYYGTLSNNE